MANSLTVDRDALLGAIELLNKIDPTSSMACSTVIKFSRHKSGLYMQLTADAAAVVHVKGEGVFPFEDFYVHRDVFIPWAKVGHSTKGNFAFHERKGQLVTVHGKRKLMVACEDQTSGYGAAKAGKSDTEIELDDDTFHALKAASLVSGKDDVDPELTCVYLDGKGHAIATDDLSMVYTKVPYKGEAVPIPNASAKIAGLADSLHVGKVLTMGFPNGRITQPIPADALEAYPLEKLMKAIKMTKNYPVQIKTTVGRFESLVNHFAGATSKVNNKGIVLEFTYRKGKLANGKIGVSLRLQDKPAEMVDASFPATETTIEHDGPIILPVAVLGSVAKMLAELKDSDAELTLSWTPDSSVVVFRTGTTIAMTARLMEQ